MNSIEALRAALDAEFKPYEVELTTGKKVVLKQLMRVNQTARKAALKALDVIKASQEKEDQSMEDIADLGDAVAVVLSSVTAKGKGPDLLEDLDGDLTLSMKVLQGWIEATQAPEASNSSV